jgi:hypothetical protein
MAKYKLDITSYDKFRAATKGKLFDIDGAYGAQCWDGAALLWQQLGRSLATGNGYAEGCWRLKRTENAGKDFDLITDPKKIKRGDVIVFGTKIGTAGHIGFADEDYSTKKTTLACYGENQGGTAGKGAASAFCVKAYNSSWIIGAFRFKKWAASVTTATPTKPTQPTAPKIKVGSSVKLKNGAKDYNGKSLAAFVFGRKHIVSEISGSRAVIKYGGVVVAAVKLSDLTLA